MSLATIEAYRAKLHPFLWYCKHYNLPENIIDFIKTNHPNIATGTVYKTLETFVEKGLIKKVKTKTVRKDNNMAFDFQIFGDPQLREDFVNWLITDRWPDTFAHFTRLWEYYQNPTRPLSLTPAGMHESARPYMQAQEIGLPPRITGLTYSANAGLEAGQRVEDIRRKEIVIDNFREIVRAYGRLPLRVHPPLNHAGYPRKRS
jgi:hypothetical protein